MCFNKALFRSVLRGQVYRRDKSGELQYGVSKVLQSFREMVSLLQSAFLVFRFYERPIGVADHLDSGTVPGRKWGGQIGSKNRKKNAETVT